METQKKNSATAKLVICSLLALGMVAPLAQGAVPGLISYQGQLNDQNGQPVSGTLTVVFGLYAASSGGTAIWTETQTVQVAAGLFSVQLGSVQAIPPTVFSQGELFLGIRVGADSEMVPRQRLTPAAFSHRAEQATSPVPPIGAILAWNKSMAGTPALPSGWVECNGQTISDALSPYNGQVAPNLNGVSSSARFLRGGTSSGLVGGSEDHNHQWHGYTCCPDNGQNIGLGNTGNNGGTAYGFDSNGGGTAFAPGGQWSLRTSFFTTKVDTKPSYFTVVWIMRIR